MLPEPHLTYYRLKMDDELRRSYGQAYQDAVWRVMRFAHGSDFIRTRTQGPIGDRKNDGFLQSSGTLFAVYAPDRLKDQETTEKLEEDFRGGFAHWRAFVRAWTFVHNG
ncbi:MAG: hypothetical protein WEA81_02940, partial [Dehalococcoidia bacterium]